MVRSPTHTMYRVQFIQGKRVLHIPVVRKVKHFLNLVQHLCPHGVRERPILLIQLVITLPKNIERGPNRWCKGEEDHTQANKETETPSPVVTRGSGGAPRGRRKTEWEHSYNTNFELRFKSNRLAYFGTDLRSPSSLSKEDFFPSLFTTLEISMSMFLPDVTMSLQILLTTIFYYYYWYGFATTKLLSN